MNAPTVRTLVPSGMHRVATRLGIRDGEAYTVVVGKADDYEAMRAKAKNG